MGSKPYRVIRRQMLNTDANNNDNTQVPEERGTRDRSWCHMLTAEEQLPGKEREQGHDSAIVVTQFLPPDTVLKDELDLARE